MLAVTEKTPIVKNLLLTLLCPFLSTFQQTFYMLVEQLSLWLTRFYEQFKEDKQCVDIRILQG
jgi:hypothetical protein